VGTRDNPECYRCLEECLRHDGLDYCYIECEPYCYEEGVHDPIGEDEV